MEYIISINYFGSENMKVASIGAKIIIMAVFLVLFAGIYLGIHVRNTYQNADGKKMAISLADALRRHHDSKGYLPVSILRKMDSIGLLSDKRGIRYDLKIEDSAFELVYLPRSTTVFPFLKQNPQRLNIRWNAGMERLKIESSIKLP